ncbi:GIY-YIG nuclease family protein [Streptomyces sp. NRRL F-5630]|uniref:GIY-YIG nuclease family protein n=1 Tax=Streptomyces sp. NRRL F-5630 TaxID=1463864 RepID=UPI003D723B9D
MSLDGDEAEIIGCIECDWDAITHQDLEEDLTGRERFIRRWETPRRCMAATRSGSRCQLLVYTDDVYCRKHVDTRALWDRSYALFRSPWRETSLSEAYREVFIRAIHDAELVADAQQVTRETFEEARRLRHAAVVYFVRREGFIKIGTTTSLKSRLASLAQGSCLMPGGVKPGPVELLATTPGGRRTESLYHEMFAAQRVQGEWFRPNKRLLNLVDDLKRAEVNGRADILDEVLADLPMAG